MKRVEDRKGSSPGKTKHYITVLIKKKKKKREILLIQLTYLDA